jgi:predicted AlkP superfamily phosphohydrolase/phosphomutase
MACLGPRPSEQYHQKLVVLGFDGMDPDLVQKWIDAGKLPNMQKVATQGVLRIETTPSPGASAWASFATGTNPGKHNIFDTIVRDTRNYSTSSGLVHRDPPRVLFDYFPVAAQRLTPLRRGTSFWVAAGKAGVRSSVLTVPLTFPPEEVPNGELLAGWPLPDIRGTAGTFSYFATDLTRAEEGASESGGTRRRLVFDGDTAHADLVGPPGPTGSGRNVTLPLSIFWNRAGKMATIDIGDSSVHLQEGEWSKWIHLDFRANLLVRTHGMAQLYLIHAGTALQLYVSPIHWNPDNPPAPMSSPASLSGDLYERLGPYRTLGWADATSALDANLIDEKVFMDDMYRAFDDRAQVILQRIDTHHWDLLVGGVESIDHVQHMMWRLTDPTHPMYDRALAAKFGDAIERVYRRCDELVGEVIARIEPATPVVIVSGYGFHSFKQSVNLNAWLAREGFLTRQGRAIVWSRTKAYALGFGQIYLNLKGRERSGIVAPGVEARAVEDDLAARLTALTDPNTGARIVQAVYRAGALYRGPYAANAPELQVGTADGYRAAWQTTADAGAEAVLSANMKKWSGDHESFDYKSIPGTLMSSRRIRAADPGIIDIAPTVLRYFGVPIPMEIDGKPLF